MSELVERVAKALGGDEFDYPNDRERFMREAREAIAAMREPTDAILVAGIEAHEHFTDRAETTRLWQAMIDAALK